MPGTSRVRALVFAALLAAGCQDYNFNPVGECLIKPNLKQVTLSDITTADVLFVVDDSGSMAGEQARLAAAFDTFITNLNTTNVNRVAQGLVPIDFHLAVTTTSVFENLPDPSTPTCRNDCPDPQGGHVNGLVCCQTSGSTPIAPLLTVRTCTGPTDTTSCPSGTTCQNDCISYLGEYACCDASKIPSRTQQVPCTTQGAACGDLSTHYRSSSDPTCSAMNGKKYPQGDFVASGSNPTILHFDKSIYAPPSGSTCTPGVDCANNQGQTASQLIGWFKANVQVGTCGSNEEDGLEAARRAVEYWETQPAATREFLHPNSKLVAVFVSDEDDCSSPQDASAGVILSYDPAYPGQPRHDSCATEQTKPLDEQKLVPISTYTQFLTRQLDPQPPVGAAFIVSAKAGDQNTCVDETCVADQCCDTACDPTCTLTSPTCGGQSKGARFLEAAGQMRSNDADVVSASICDGDFGTILGRIAEIVKPPTGLALPSQPAAEEVTVLRIVDVGGGTRKTCNGPAPDSLDAAQAAAANYDWWFTASREQLTDPQKHPTTPSKYVYINHATNNCEASPGETYSAEYIGRLPDNGCTGSGATPDEARQAADDNCVAMLGGRPGDWTCFAGTDSAGVCVVPTGTVIGTCLCGPRYIPPPDGSPPGTAGQGICPFN